MFDIGGGELILIVLAVIVLFGPKKIPEVAQMLRKGMANFYKAQQEIKEQFSNIESEIKSTVKDIDNTVQKPVNSPQAPENSIPARRFKDIQTDLKIDETAQEDLSNTTPDMK